MAAEGTLLREPCREQGARALEVRHPLLGSTALPTGSIGSRQLAMIMVLPIHLQLQVVATLHLHTLHLQLPDLVVQALKQIPISWVVQVLT